MQLRKKGTERDHDNILRVPHKHPVCIPEPQADQTCTACTQDPTVRGDSEKYQGVHESYFMTLHENTEQAASGSTSADIRCAGTTCR